MGVIRLEFVVLLTAALAALVAIADLAGLKIPLLPDHRGGAPSRLGRAIRLTACGAVIAICVYGMYSEATSGRSLSRMVACTVFSSGASCHDEETRVRDSTADEDKPGPEAALEDPVDVEPAGRAGNRPGSFCNPVNSATDNPELDAMYMTAWNLDRGIGGRRDRAEARQLYRDAAERGDRASQYNLAVMLHRGHGGPVDNESAVHWFRLAANQDDLLAVINLAAAYSDGWPGVERNRPRALEYYLIASRCDRANISNNIGVIYVLGGDGVERDLARASTWFRKAEAQGSRYAAQNLSAIADGFDPRTDSVFWDELGSQ